jgi:hypothetical protein
MFVLHYLSCPWKTVYRSKLYAIEIGRYNFERTDSYVYLGLLVNGDNYVSEEITNRLTAANQSFLG